MSLYNILGNEMSKPGKIDFSRPSADTLHAALSGTWKFDSRPPPAGDVVQQLEADPTVKNLIIDTRDIAGWDSGLLTFLIAATETCRSRNIIFEHHGLPEGAQRLLNISAVVPEQKGARQQRKCDSFFYIVGENVVDFTNSTIELLEFVGDATLSFLRFLGGKARFRTTDLLQHIEDSGAHALPIVTLVSVLVGLILAFVGAVQLKMFGAQIFVADLVAIATVREMGAIMTAIIMAGRTGAAYAAQLGTMQVNEEIDALTTLGIPPMDFLVLPRMLALLLMMPLLCIYADLMGIMGGAIVGISMLDITAVQYFKQTQAAIDLTNISLGVSKSLAFAIIVALSGCMRGMQCGRSASAVGDAATSAVVTAIVWIIVTDGLFAVLCDILNI
jgi:phospholipid/cholesterol/gamma-HCH transport system permease protein